MSRALLSTQHSARFVRPTRPCLTTETLVSEGSQFDWVPASDGRLANGAVQGGSCSSGEPLYIGRTFHEGTLTIGKVHPSHGCLYIPYGGEEHRYSDYEVLVCKSVNF
ncbi:conserved hypothetical protein [Ixodes scapularis]|uniref:Uncharacterized protein n=1 Tax=Ixodes scapularis TaxID=6945 RepID=B7QDU9_IXOSC|nr:conserved hypothetical protein [Ixodes scapularis]|eukprot:XP_002413713.1 conserved hypothetical protein [Ixodes scapularis]